jgi:hypothetical protein
LIQSAAAENRECLEAYIFAAEAYLIIANVTEAFKVLDTASQILLKVQDGFAVLIFSLVSHYF